jgi:shikimate dehydrogenase
MSESITGLIGYPVAHSKSPRIHGIWRQRHNIAGRYELLAIAPEHLAREIPKLKARGLAGFNVTVPHKITIMEYLDGVDAAAQKIGAVNIVTHHNGRWLGSNSDAYGFITHLRESLGELAPYLPRVVLLGAGGAARAAMVALKEAGAGEMIVTNRTLESAQKLATEFGAEVTPWDARENALSGATLLVNTTSLGMAGKEPLLLNLEKLPRAAAVYDIVYAPLETNLLREARARGHKAVDGLGMLLYQAQRAFTLWHGVTPAVDEELRQEVLAS